MNYSFKNIYSKAKVAVETDRYVIYQTLKSKLNFSGNYLLMKKEAETIEDLEYYITSCRNFFRDKGVDFIHIASSENTSLPKKLNKYLKKQGYNEINLDLYHLDINDFIEQEETEYTVEYLQKKDLSRYLKFQYKIDIESSNEEWAEHNQELLYDEIRSENIIVKTDYFEIDNLYVNKEYRRRGIAKQLLSYAIKNENKSNIVLVADANDTPKYMYEKVGFKKISEQDFYLKSKL